MGQTDRNPAVGLILILGAVGIGGYLWYDGTQPKVPVKPARLTANVNDDANRQRLERVVNTHVQMTNQRIEIEKEQIKVEASFTVPRVGEFVIQQSDGDRSFNQRPDRAELNAVRDLRPRSTVNVSANDIIQSEIATQQAQAEYDQEYNREYAKQFVDNARRNGYDVKLSSDYRVIGVKPVGRTGNGDSFR